ncbi:hypothetical protein BRADI_4g32267v3 [Brachypodium distachyon]|uniref:J domain-containing protein n=1 Tax=Brachypodium distachyon TaxID=15368 RepID=A0A2K2CRS1_BRADI|nr:hypothetical protein BRADI_4g32267v3 [Brachypodium distachyon]
MRRGFVSSDSNPAFAILQGSNISSQIILYEVLSVGEDATYDEIRAAYKSAALNTHPDKAERPLNVQKAWKILRYPTSKAEYDKQLQSSRQSLEIIALDIQIEDMIVENSADAVELLYACGCGDYFSITSCELGDMGILVSEDGEIEVQASDSLSASIVLGCGSCSLKTRLVINKT